MNSIRNESLTLPREVPIMVLPNALLFPNSLLPLYIFEQRYREMLASCIKKERMFCVALMKPGVTDAETDHDFYHVGGLGMIRACVERADGTSHLILQGLTRVQFTRFVQDEPFRIAEIAELRSHTGDQLEADALGAKVVELCKTLREAGAEVPAALDKHLAHLSNPELLSDIVTHTFISDPFRRQNILEQLGVSERLRLLIRYLGQEMK